MFFLTQLRQKKKDASQSAMQKLNDQNKIEEEGRMLRGRTGTLLAIEN